MKVQDAQSPKRERLKSGMKHVLGSKLDVRDPRVRADLSAFFLREHHLGRLLATRYAEAVATIVEGFPEGDAPEDVIDSHVEVLGFHDEPYAKKLFPSDDLLVHVLRGTCNVARRWFQWLDAGDQFTLGGRTFKVTAVTRERVGDVTEDQAREEGARSLDEWRRRWLENVPRSAGEPVWSPEHHCVKHEFKAVDG